jgi:medium-chain acyl-[acyl-carrier-protein] hydrolase
MGSGVLHPVWRENFQVRSYDIGFNGRMRISRLCSYFQEVAGKHASHLNLGYRYMQESGMVWVLSRLYVEFLKFPGWGDDFYLETWPLGMERIFFRRDYRMDNGSETLITAASYWIPIDITTRKPCKVPLDENVLMANRGRYGLKIPDGNIPAPSGGDTGYIQVKYSDLDQNGHVNNARYVEWIFDHLGHDVADKPAPRFFAIEYKHEVKLEDNVMLRKQVSGTHKNEFIVDGTLTGTGQVCLRSRIVY